MADLPSAPAFDAWHPGLQSQVPRELLPLASIFRAEHSFTSVAMAEELRGLTGFALSEHVTFRPERLALHELLIRVTADLSVPDGNRIEDLGINFRRIVVELWSQCIEPELPLLIESYHEARRAVGSAMELAWAAAIGGRTDSPPMPRRAWHSIWRARVLPQPTAASRTVERAWGLPQIAECERLVKSASCEVQGLALRTLARVMSALFNHQGAPWGTREFILRVATDMASNAWCSDAIGARIEPLLQAAVRKGGYRLLPAQLHPIVINTKGASAAGKSSLRPLQKKLAGDIGVDWRNFALISPDIWRKQLLDYNALGTAYKYAGALAADELHIIDRKLDGYMARKNRDGRMSHLLIDRFRFDSFAPESDLAGSNLLTRFGETVYLFFMITPPENLVERAWNRGLEFGRYKAVDDTLAHAIEAYSGMPQLFFTWVRRSDKRLQFEFLDNTVAFGERPRTIAFGDRGTLNLLDVGALCRVERYARINVNAACPRDLYAEDEQPGGIIHINFLAACIREFATVNFAAHGSGRIYLRVAAGQVAWVDPQTLRIALADPATAAGIRATVPDALYETAPRKTAAEYLDGRLLKPTLGSWGTWRER